MFCLTCAFAIRRSDIAAATMAAMSGDSQNAWMETRGTGSICAIGRSTDASPSNALLLLCAFMDSLPRRPDLLADRDHIHVGLTLAPHRARILAVADVLDGSRAHRDVGRPERVRLDEITGIVDLGRDHRLGGAAEVRIGFVLPPLDRRPRSQIL